LFEEADLDRDGIKTQPLVIATDTRQLATLGVENHHLVGGAETCGHCRRGMKSKAVLALVELNLAGIAAERIGVECDCRSG
jgi:hypothetical protein